MVVIAGLARKRHPIVATQDVCPLCHREAVRVGVADKRAFSIFWIPFIPLGSSRKFICLMCGGEQKVRSLVPPPGPEIPPAEIRSRLSELMARQGEAAQSPGTPPPTPPYTPPPTGPPSMPPPIHPR